jgi:hypothetical protein
MRLAREFNVLLFMSASAKIETRSDATTYLGVRGGDPDTIRVFDYVFAKRAAKEARGQNACNYKFVFFRRVAY